MATNDDWTDFVKARITAFDPTIDLTEGSPAMRQIVEPIVTRAGDDPFSLDAQTLIRTRINQEYPEMATDEGSGVDDTIVLPNVPVVQAFSRTMQQMQYNQSFVNLDLMTSDAVDALLANFFSTRDGGGFATGPGRVYFESPKFVVFSGAVRATSKGGFVFIPATPQQITAEQMAQQREGQYYYADVVFRAEAAGEDYNIEEGRLSGISGVDGVVRITNLVRFEGGLPQESNSEARDRADLSLTERSLTSDRGIFSRLMSLYGSNLRTLVVTGMGDPEMNRDILTGNGEGSLVSSGVCLAIGNFAIHLGLYENRGLDGTIGLEVGQELDMNFWELLYGLPSYQQHERFFIDAILADSRNLIPKAPSCALLQLSGSPTPTGTVISSGIPGVLPGVFTAVRGEGRIAVSDIPGGIIRPVTINGILEINENQIHIGGKHDIWVRPVADSSKTAKIDELTDEQPVVAGNTLSTQGLTATPNRVVSSDATIDWLAIGAEEGHLLYIGTGVDQGTYTILKVTSDYLVVDADMTGSEIGLVFKVVDEVQMDLFNPKNLKVPFGSDVPGNDLQTIIGSDILQIGTNIITYGAEVGDVIEILEGNNAGRYTILEFDTSGGGTTPKVDRIMGSTDSNLQYQVYTQLEAVQRPLVRIKPEGVRLLDSSNQTTDTTIPPALPVDARNINGFTGAETVCTGQWGFALPDPGPIFRPNDGQPCNLADYVASLTDSVNDTSLSSASKAALIAELEEMEDLVGDFGCYSDACLPCNGWIACVRITSHRFHVSFLPNAGFVTFIDQIIDWCNQVFDAFFRQQLEILPDVTSEGFSWTFTTPLAGRGANDQEIPLWQTEICIPQEFFDCCSNVWIGLPEFDVQRLGQIVNDTLGEDGLKNLEKLFEPDTVQEILTLIAGADDPCVLQAQPGDALEVTEGPNTGGYIVREVYKYQARLPFTDPAGTSAADIIDWLDTIPLLNLGVVIIEGEFPVETCCKLCDFFAEGFPDEPPLPGVPQFDGYCYDDYGDVSPFDWIIKFFQWLIEWLRVLGLDIPDDLEVDWGNLIEKIWEALFPGYQVGQATCQDTIRVYWTEPTTAEFDGGGECVILDDGDPLTEPRVLRAGTPSRFSATVGSTEVSYAASMDVDPYMVVPSKPTVEDVDDLEWPRDLLIVPGAVGVDPTARITDLSVPAPIALGLLEMRDVLLLHEERFLISDKTRRPAFKTVNGSSVVTLLDSFPHAVIADQVIEVGDLVFIEEGLDEGAYRVVGKINDKQFELDRPMVESTPAIVSHGADGSFDGSAASPANKRLTSVAKPFTSLDVGRYLTSYGTANEIDDLSRQITAVAPDGSWAELDQAFTTTVASGSLWCVTAAPLAAPVSTGAGGTELVGLRPFRIYDGQESQWMVTEVSETLNSSTATMTLQLLTEVRNGLPHTTKPTDGERQPYSIVRPGIQRITSTQMAENEERGLYYFDVQVRSLGSDPTHNIAEGTKLEPVFGTFKSDGYRYEVENVDFTFSAYEECTLVFSPRILPVGAEDDQAAFLPTRGQKLQIVYQHATVVNQIQQLVASELERQLVSDPLVRHFIPQYLYLDVSYTGGSAPAVITKDLQDYINALTARSEVSVAALEKLLDSRGATDWTHPIEIIVVTLDLDRRMVAERSVDRLGGTDEVLYNGTNRISFLIPGPDVSGIDEEDVPAGERIRLTQDTEVIV